MSLLAPIFDDGPRCWWPHAFLLTDACGIPGIYGPGRIALGHVPFYRAIECCDHTCPDPSNCPPRTRDTFEQAIQLDQTDITARTPEQPEPRPRPCAGEPESPIPSAVAQRPRAATSSAKLGEVLPVPREKTVSITRTINRFVTPSMPGRFIDLMV